ncbi:MAG: site-2 protease family protein [Holosporaceae bacterium]|nr:site-2 protease family protein [Holosporaceae bacterium]
MLYYIISFLVIINVIVFVHEVGHYLAARKIGARVMKFSIGMGPELCGFDDKRGTRWCFSILPVGGYVMMLGDADASSMTTDDELLNELNETEKSQALANKSNFEKMLVAFCGPFANYLYAFLVIIILSISSGVPFHEPTIGSVLPGSAAEKACIIPGDKVLSVNGQRVEKYRDVVRAVFDSTDEKVHLVLEREGKQLAIDVVPDLIEKKKIFGKNKKIKQLGIRSAEPILIKKTFLEAVGYAFCECLSSTKEILAGLGDLFTAKRGLDDFGGIVHMASVAGDIAKDGNLILLIMYTVTLSLNLGLLNLLPLPVLDGGTILIVFLEQVFRRKLNKKLLEYIMAGCAAFFIFIMAVVVVNDVLRIGCVSSFLSKIFG